LALENLQEIEKMPAEERKNAETVLNGVMGSMYTGERPCYSTRKIGIKVVRSRKLVRTR